MIKMCRICFQDEEHSVRKNGKPFSWCKACQRQYAKDHYNKSVEEGSATYTARKRSNRDAHKTRVREHIRKCKEVPCMDCGKEYPTCVMDFDHVRGEKKFNVGAGATTKSLPQIIEEIEKCEVVCSNCHRIRTHARLLENGNPPVLDTGDREFDSPQPD